MAYQFSNAEALFDWLDEYLSETAAEEAIVRLMEFCQEPWADWTVRSAGRPLTVIVSAAGAEFTLLVAEPFRIIRFIEARLLEP